MKPRPGPLSAEQFDELNRWIQAEIRAAMVRNSSGQHVSKLQDDANAYSLLARKALTGSITPEAKRALKKAGYLP